MIICFTNKAINYNWLNKFCESKIPISINRERPIYNGVSMNNDIGWRQEYILDVKCIKRYTVREIIVRDSGMAAQIAFKINSYYHSWIWLQSIISQEKSTKGQSIHQLVNYHPEKYQDHDDRCNLIEEMIKQTGFNRIYLR